jgi:hypothetical protein
VKEVPDTGHFVMLEKAVEFNRLSADFLKRIKFWTMLGASAAFLFASGVMLLCFAVHPAALETVHNALRDLAVLMLGETPGFWSEEPLSRTERAILAVTGAILVWLSGAAMA